jgi:hypothetical protein
MGERHITSEGTKSLEAESTLYTIGQEETRGRRGGRRQEAREEDARIRQEQKKRQRPRVVARDNTPQTYLRPLPRRFGAGGSNQEEGRVWSDDG